MTESAGNITKKSSEEIITLLRRTLSKDAKFIEDGKPAAVLIPLVMINGQLYVILIRRSKKLKYHGGEYGFPGGVKENDETPLQTAFREAEEELGIKKDFVEVLGFLPSIRTYITNFSIVPVVGLLSMPEGFTFNVNPKEVEEVILPPLSHLMEEAHQDMFGKYYLYDKHKIWGASARILSKLLEIIKR
ncbi:MAG: NUDIX hydrolase [Candidatus Freyarchaeota archaeon]|nr:CoA pyrophosphatase [Candidatus Freyrarchaeum guaymaensis]